MALSEHIGKRRAIEALRSGVPNRDAVAELGSAQPHIEEKFAQQLEAARGDVANDIQTPGLLVAGGFGSGKSHLLEYLHHRALEANFVSSKVVISKETPLHDPAKVYRAAIQAAVVPGKKGFALTEIASVLNFNSQGFAELFTWVKGTKAGLSSHFPATLFLYERETDEEVRDRIISFWSGDPLQVGELRSWLRDHGEAATYKLERVGAKEMPLQRFRFASRLMVAAGYSGWVLLVDEVELIGQYSFKSRARSYAELARWAGRLEGQAFPGLTVVFAITDDFTSIVLDTRNDQERIPGKLRASGVAADSLLASQAERGMGLISKGATPLGGPGPGVIESTKDRVREIHAGAYHWRPQPLPSTQREQSTRMREYVRSWINAWDLINLDPGYTPDTEVLDLEIDYSENPDLESRSEGDPDKNS
jgi:hypothetical protein